MHFFLIAKFFHLEVHSKLRSADFPLSSFRYDPRAEGKNRTLSCLHLHRNPPAQSSQCRQDTSQMHSLLEFAVRTEPLFPEYSISRIQDLQARPYLPEALPCQKEHSSRHPCH